MFVELNFFCNTCKNRHIYTILTIKLIRVSKVILINGRNGDKSCSPKAKAAFSQNNFSRFNNFITLAAP
jgi:hypothetical protein